MKYEIVGFFKSNCTGIRGCGMVEKNLLLGLEKLGIEVFFDIEKKYNACPYLWGRRVNLIPEDTLMGPCIDSVLPVEYPQLWERFNRFVFPKGTHFFDYQPPGKKIYEWAVGIDTNYYFPEIKTDVPKGFIYYKTSNHQVNDSDFQTVLREFKEVPKILKYGYYVHEDKMKVVRECNFGVYLGGTESQGIALMEFLSAGIPLYVIDKHNIQWAGKIIGQGSSAPYWDDRCGIKTGNMNRFTEFLENLPAYKPREFIMENFTLEKCAQKYYDILTGGYNE